MRVGATAYHLVVNHHEVSLPHAPAERIHWVGRDHAATGSGSATSAATGVTWGKGRR